MSGLIDLRRRLRKRLRGMSEDGVDGFLPGPDDEEPGRGSTRPPEPQPSAGSFLPGPGDESFLPPSGSATPAPGDEGSPHGFLPAGASPEPPPRPAPSDRNPSRTAADRGPALPPGRSVGREPRPVESHNLSELLPGEVVDSALGGCYRIAWAAEDLEAGCAEAVAAWRGAAAVAKGGSRLAQALRRDPERVVFLDLETCGLHNVPLFLCGLGSMAGERIALDLFLARQLGEEAAVIGAVAEVLAGAEAVVTFNGEGFDLPFLRQRAAYHRVPLTLPACHLDLLLVARRRYGRRFGDCRLQTLEREVCGRPRMDDLDSARIPATYQRFCREGDAALLRPILEHNARDLITLVDLGARMAAPADGQP